MVKFIFPELRQFYDYDCGAATMEGVLAYYGLDVPETYVMKIAGTNRRIGTSPNGLRRVAEKFGLKYKEGGMSIRKLKKYIRKKIPVIILIQDLWDARKLKGYNENKDLGHYVIPVGFDKEKVYFEDPWSFFRVYLTFHELKKSWKAMKLKRKKFEEVENYGIAFYGRKPLYLGSHTIHMGIGLQNENLLVKNAKF